MPRFYIVVHQARGNDQAVVYDTENLKPLYGNKKLMAGAPVYDSTISAAEDEDYVRKLIKKRGTPITAPGLHTLTDAVEWAAQNGWDDKTLNDTRTAQEKLSNLNQRAEELEMALKEVADNTEGLFHTSLSHAAKSTLYSAKSIRTSIGGAIRVSQLALSMDAPEELFSRISPHTSYADFLIETDNAELAMRVLPPNIGMYMGRNSCTSASPINNKPERATHRICPAVLEVGYSRTHHGVSTGKCHLRWYHVHENTTVEIRLEMPKSLVVYSNEWSDGRFPRPTERRLVESNVEPTLYNAEHEFTLRTGYVSYYAGDNNGPGNQLLYWEAYSSDEEYNNMEEGILHVQHIINALMETSKS
jgi:hypothetical protein